MLLSLPFAATRIEQDKRVGRHVAQLPLTDAANEVEVTLVNALSLVR
jgi:hypothetical protein